MLSVLSSFCRIRVKFNIIHTFFQTRPCLSTTANETRMTDIKYHRPIPMSSIGGDDKVSVVCEALKRILPRTEFQMAYGSAVFRQAGYTAAESPMVDFLLAVNDPLKWHAENLRKNSSHYSFLKYTGVDCIVTIQNTAAQAYFHPFVSIDIDGQTEPCSVKYGVMSVKALTNDLLHWTSLYTVGRMQKVSGECICF